MGRYARGVALDLIAELEAVLDALAREQIDYALCGGIALSVHGHVRATTDIDLLVRAADVDRVKTMARALGFDIPARVITFGLRNGKPHTVHRLSKIDPDTSALMPMDLLVVEPVYEAVWQGRISLQYRGKPLSVVSREGLATMKRMAGRPQDLADLAKLEGDDET